MLITPYLKKIMMNKVMRRTLIISVVIIGIFLRFYVMSRGHNFDFESYKIVGDIVKNGANVYSETDRYNYGPIWFYILGLFRIIADLFSNHDLFFRIFIVTLLTSVDLAIAFILNKKYGLSAFILFFLNPISIIITGYHNQFDNLAILIGLAGFLMLPSADVRNIKRNHIYSALLIGLSLMTKHIFFAIPLWFFIRNSSLRVKLFMLTVPTLIFILGFLPYWMVGHDGIIKNVFMYKSFANAPLINSILPNGLIALINPMVMFLAVLIIAGFMTRKLPAIESGLWYLIVIVVFSPAIANQYLAIAMPAVVSLGVAFFIPFVCMSTFLLAGSSTQGLHSKKIINIIPDQIMPYINPNSTLSHYNLIIFCLFIGMILTIVYRYRRGWYTKIYNKIKIELSYQLNCFINK